MPVPVVAIVGRPNVGKSSLLNSIARRMISIVDPTAGVTRDRVSTICAIDDFYFELVDTGGYGIEDKDNLTEHVERQIRFAVDRADLILFVVDVQTGVAPLDTEVARMLRPLHDRVVLLANKADDLAKEHLTGEFVRLGFGEALPISALHHSGRGELLDLIVDRLKDGPQTDPGEPVMMVAVVGRQNTGKSTFINALAGEEHVIVSEVPGTTRDAVDLRFERNGKTFIAIDTAGVRKRSKSGNDPIEFYGYTRVLKSIRRADVCLLFIDSTEAMTAVDKKLARSVADEKKPCVLVVNKWDLAKSMAATGDYDDYLDKTLPGLDFAPVVFVSAKDGQNVDAVIDTAWALFNQSRTRVSTGPLNQALEAVVSARAPSPKRGAKPPKVYYATQVATSPPTIVIFVNNPTLLSTGYQRYLLNGLRTQLPFPEVPIRLVLRPRRGRDGLRGSADKEGGRRSRVADH